MPFYRLYDFTDWNDDDINKNQGAWDVLTSLLETSDQLLIIWFMFNYHLNEMLLSPCDLNCGEKNKTNVYSTPRKYSKPLHYQLADSGLLVAMETQPSLIHFLAIPDFAKLNDTFSNNFGHSASCYTSPVLFLLLENIFSSSDAVWSQDGSIISLQMRSQWHQ